MGANEDFSVVWYGLAVKAMLFANAEQKQRILKAHQEGDFCEVGRILCGLWGRECTMANLKTLRGEDGC